MDHVQKLDGTETDVPGMSNVQSCDDKDMNKHWLVSVNKIGPFLLML